MSRGPSTQAGAPSPASTAFLAENIDVVTSYPWPRWAMDLGANQISEEFSTKLKAPAAFAKTDLVELLTYAR